MQEEEQKQIVIVNNIPGGDAPGNPSRTISVVGEIDEKLSAEVISTLLFMRDSGTVEELEDPSDPEGSKVIEVKLPIELVISTFGGSTPEMFGIYDLVRSLREECEILTFGVGKVMSAGVLLLASGTKGSRRIGKNCRVMLHGISAGFNGSLVNMENDFEEMRWIQKTYTECLAAETKLSVKKINKMFRKQMDVYISAADAIKFGIADEVV